MNPGLNPGFGVLRCGPSSSFVGEFVMPYSEITAYNELVYLMVWEPAGTVLYSANHNEALTFE
jgi:hypothetical protein